MRDGPDLADASRVSRCERAQTESHITAFPVVCGVTASRHDGNSPAA